MFLGLPEPHPDPLVRGTDPRIRIHIQISRYQNVTDSQHWFWKANPDMWRPKIKLRRPLEAHRGNVKAQIGAIELADLNLFDEEQDPDSEPHQSEKRDPDSHHGVSDSQQRKTVAKYFFSEPNFSTVLIYPDHSQFQQ